MNHAHQSNLIHRSVRTSATWLLPFLLLLLAAVAHAQFTYTTNNRTITITGYTGPGGAVTIPSTINGLPVTSIGHWAFSWCSSLARVTIPKSVASIGDSVFYYCWSLSSITIPDSVTSIGDQAFYNCKSLSDVTIPNSVTNIGEAVFASCISLSAITVDAPNPVYSSVDGVLFNKTQTTLMEYPGGKPGGYAIPGSVTSIGEAAFGGRSNLTSVTIPSSVTKIGQAAFAECTSLISVTIPHSVTSVGEYAFAECSSLTSVYFQGNAPSADSSVFYLYNNATVYYLPGTTGWGTSFGGRPTALWLLPNPLILTSGPSFGVQTNHFGFIISWATNIPVVVEASTNLSNTTWSPLATNTLTNGTSCFTDPQWTNYLARFYRLRPP
jgi:hypothetical protein